MVHNSFDDDADESAVMVAGTSNTIEYEFLNDEYELLNDGSKTEEVPLTQTVNIYILVMQIATLE